MADFIVYQLSDGKIVKGFNGADFQLEPNVPEGCSALPGADPESLFRVDVTATPHVLIEKVEIAFSANKTSIAADGIDTVTLSDLPNPTKVTPPEGEPIDVIDGDLDIAIDLDGDWQFVLSSPLYLDTTVTITAS